MDNELHTMTGGGVPFMFRDKQCFLKTQKDLTPQDISDIFQAKRAKVFKDAKPAIDMLDGDEKISFLNRLIEKTAPPSANDESVVGEWVSSYVLSSDPDGMIYYIWVSIRDSLDIDSFDEFKGSMTVQEMQEVSQALSAMQPPAKKKKRKVKR